MSKYWFCRVERHPNLIFKSLLDVDNPQTYEFVMKTVVSYLAFDDKKMRDMFVKDLSNVTSVTKHDVIADIGRFFVLCNVCISIKRGTEGLKVFDEGLYCLRELQHWFLTSLQTGIDKDAAIYDILAVAASQIKTIKLKEQRAKKSNA